MKKILCLVALVAACEVPPMNPFDPATPPEQQALASLQAQVVAPNVAPTAITVTLSSPGREPRSKALESDARFAFADLVPGPWSVALSASGYYPYVRDLQLAAGVTLDLGEIVLVPVADAAQLVVVEGRARLAGLRSSAGIAVVAVGTSFRAVTDSEGHYLLQLTPGRYTLAFSAVGFKDEELVDLEVKQGATVTAPDVTLAANPGSVAGHVCAQVRDDLLQAGVTGGQGACEAAGPSYAAASGTTSSALVTVRGPDSPEGRTSTVDEDGFFSIGDLSPGTYTVTVEWLGYRRAFVQAVPVAGGEDVVLAAPLLLDLARGGIEGVVKLPTGAPDHSGTLVSVEGWGVAATTDAQGRFALNGLLDSALVGAYRLVATHRPTYADLRLPVDVRVEADRVTRLDGSFSLDVRTGAVQVKEGYYLSDCALTLLMASPTAQTYRVSLKPDLSDATPVAFEPPDPQRPGEFPWTMPDCASLPDGRRTIYVEFADEAGTPAAPVAVEVLLDRKAPAHLEASLAGAEARVVDGIEGPVFFTRSTTGLVALQLGALDPLSVESDDPAQQQAGSGVARVSVDDNPDFDSPVDVAFSGAISVALPEPGVDGLKKLFLRFEDRAGNVAVLSDEDGHPRPLQIVLDRVAPRDLSVAVRALTSPPDPGSTPSAQVALELEGDDEYPLLMSMRVSNDAGFRGAGWQPFAAFLPWVLSPGDGTKSVFVQVRDAAGNETPVVSSQIELSSQPPTGVSVEVLAPQVREGRVSQAATVAGGLKLGLSATDAVQMEVSGDVAGGASGWVPFAATWTGELTSGDGAKTVQVRFRTGAGQVATAAPLVLVLDTTAPVAGAPGISPSPFTGGVDVTLSLPATAADEMMLTGDLASVAGLPAHVGAWIPASPTVAAKLTAGDGTKSVSVTWRDFAGNVSSTSTASTKLDASAPTGTVSIEGPVDAGATSTTRTGARQVLLNIAGDDGAGSGVAHLRLANAAAGLSSATWVPFQSTVSWTLPAGDGARSVHLQLRDGVGNVSATAISATTTLDQTPPSAPGLAALPEATSAASVSVALATPSSDALSGPPRYEWLRTGSGAWAPVTLPATLTLVEGLNTVQVRAIDQAGNVSASATATVVRDVTAPPKPEIVTPRAFVDATTTSVTLTGSEVDPHFLTYRTCRRQVAAASTCPATCTAWEDSSAGFALSLVANEKTCLYARGVDRAGNQSAVSAVGLVSDMTRPQAPQIGPQYAPSLLTVRAGSVDAFLLSPATDLPVGDANAPWVGISHLEVGGEGGFSPLCPSSFNGDRWDPCNPQAPAGRCTDERLRCRGDEVVGFNAVVREGTRTTISVRAVDLAGNVSDASSFQVETEAPFAVARRGGNERGPDLYGTTLAYYWESDNQTGVVPMLVELGENRRVDPTDPACTLDTSSPPYYSTTVDIARSGVVYEQSSNPGLFLRKRGADGLFCTADDPAPIKLHPVGGGTPMQYDHVALGGDAVAFVDRWNVTEDNCAPVYVREGANDGPLGAPDDRFGQMNAMVHLSYLSSPSVQVAEGAILVRTGGCPRPSPEKTSEWKVFRPSTGTNGKTYLSPSIRYWTFNGSYPVLSADGTMLFDVGGAATIRYAGPDRRLGSADDVVVSRPVPGSSFDTAIDGSRAVFVTSDNDTGQSYLQVWGAGADGVFQSADDPDDDDDYRSIYPSAESRRNLVISQGLVVYESRDNLYGVDLSRMRWEVVPRGDAQAPQDTGAGGLVYVNAGQYDQALVARAPDGSETVAALPFDLGSPNSRPFLADGQDMLVIGQENYTTTHLQARRRPAGLPWFVSDETRFVTLPGGPHEFILPMATGGGRSLVFAGPWVSFRKYVLEPGPDGWADPQATFVDVTGDSLVQHNAEYAGVSASHVAWSTGGHLYVRSAGADGLFGTADDSPTAALLRPDSVPYWVKVMALDGQRLAFVENSWRFIRVLDAGVDGLFGTADDLTVDVPIDFQGLCRWDCSLKLSGDYLSWVTLDATGTEQVYVHQLSTRSTMRLTAHDSTKRGLTAFSNGRISWVDQLFSNSSLFTFTP